MKEMFVILTNIFKHIEINNYKINNEFFINLK